MPEEGGGARHPCQCLGEAPEDQGLHTGACVGELQLYGQSWSLLLDTDGDLTCSSLASARVQEYGAETKKYRKLR